MDKLNEKILKFIEEHDMQVVIQPDFSYEQFLEKIVLTTISEAERLSTLTTELEKEKHYIELTADALADELKEIKGEK